MESKCASWACTDLARVEREGKKERKKKRKRIWNAAKGISYLFCSTCGERKGGTRVVDKYEKRKKERENENELTLWWMRSRDSISRPHGKCVLMTKPNPTHYLLFPLNRLSYKVLCYRDELIQTKRSRNRYVNFSNYTESNIDWTSNTSCARVKNSIAHVYISIFFFQKFTRYIP